MNELTKAEQRIYEFLKDGYSPFEICEKLNVAFNTVKALETRVYKKTGLCGRMELLANEVKKLKKL